MPDIESDARFYFGHGYPHNFPKFDTFVQHTVLPWVIKRELVLPHVNTNWLQSSDIPQPPYPWHVNDNDEALYDWKRPEIIDAFVIEAHLKAKKEKAAAKVAGVGVSPTRSIPPVSPNRCSETASIYTIDGEDEGTPVPRPRSSSPTPSSTTQSSTHHQGGFKSLTSYFQRSKQRLMGYVESHATSGHNLQDGNPDDGQSMISLTKFGESTHTLETDIESVPKCEGNEDTMTWHDHGSYEIS